MGLIRVDTDAVAQMAVNVGSLSRTFDGVAARVTAAQSELADSISGHENIGTELSTVGKRLKIQLEQMGKLEKLLYTVNDSFSEVDNRIGKESNAVKYRMDSVTQGMVTPTVSRTSLSMAETLAAITMADAAFGKKSSVSIWLKNFWDWITGKKKKKKKPSGGSNVVTNQTPTGEPNTDTSALKPYTGSGGKYSDYSVVAGFDAAYCYDQHNYSTFENANGRNVGCTATANAIVLSIARGRAVSPENEVKWSPPEGVVWTDVHSLKGSNGQTTGYSKEEKLTLIGEQLSQGNAVIVRANAGHTVAAVGIKNGADPSNLSPSDILIIDPADGKVKALSEAASGGCTLPTDWSIKVAN